MAIGGILAALGALAWWRRLVGGNTARDASLAEAFGREARRRTELELEASLERAEAETMKDRAATRAEVDRDGSSLADTLRRYNRGG